LRRADDAEAAASAAVVLTAGSRPADWLVPCAGELIASFNAWLEQEEPGLNPWPAFDRWVRDALNQSMRARRVRCFRATDTAHRLLSLTNELEEPLWPAGTLPGLVEHVLATGRSFIKGDRNNGELIERLVSAWSMDPARPTGPNSAAPQWLLPVRQRNRTIGLILVGELPEAAIGDANGLTAVGGWLSLFWRHVRQQEALAVAEQTDRTSGVLTRIDLTARAEKVVAESAGDGEPVVLIALAVEGVRRLNDQGHWELRDQLMREIGNQTRRKLRSDDLVGRFSEDRFVMVLRRLDLALGEMIGRKILAAVETVVHEQPVLEETVRVRCGLTDAGPDGFEAAVARAFQALNEARRQDRNLPLALPRREQELLAVSGASA
jgi:diguanylate cyclase (GGDEF)-like protein